MGDTRRARTVDRDEVIDAWAVFTEEMLHTPQVADAFFAHVPNEEDVGFGADVRLVHCAQHGEYGREPARIVSDAWSEERVTAHPNRDVRLRWEHRVQVAGDREDISRPGPAAQSDHITDLVDPRAVHAYVLHHLEEGEPTLLFHEGWRRDLRQRHEIGHRLVVGLLDVLEGRTHRRVVHERTNLGLVFLLALRRGVGRGPSHDEHGEKQGCE